MLRIRTIALELALPELLGVVPQLACGSLRTAPRCLQPPQLLLLEKLLDHCQQGKKALFRIYEDFPAKYTSPPPPNRKEASKGNKHTYWARKPGAQPAADRGRLRV